MMEARQRLSVAMSRVAADYVALVDAERPDLDGIAWRARDRLRGGDMAGRGRIRAADIALVRERSKIDEIVGEHLQLKRAGGGSLKGLCPFHDDQRPSLVIDERDQHFHCYGCRAHGDVISWVMRRDGLSFTAACDLLTGPPRSARPAATTPAAHRSERVIGVREEQLGEVLA